MTVISHKERKQLFRIRNLWTWQFILNAHNVILQWVPQKPKCIVIYQPCDDFSIKNLLVSSAKVFKGNVKDCECPLIWQTTIKLVKYQQLEYFRVIDWVMGVVDKSHDYGYGVWEYKILGRNKYQWRGEQRRIKTKHVIISYNLANLQHVGKILCRLEKRCDNMSP